MQFLAHLGWVVLGGGIGSGLRFGVGRVALVAFGPSYPAGTLIVNVLGCVVMGVLAEWLAFRDTGIDVSMKLFLTTGFLGGFTTFSAFALDAAALWERGEALSATVYVLASVVLSIGGLFAGMALTRAAFAA
ncbi:MAG TPA: fluoride efflux transporter CrcB [Steroidobacteraceae bacterium]|jgi:CrcB protein|nr:fluoride efflux transporter CrcB [Steroidobacteraceae bacterium]